MRSRGLSARERGGSSWLRWLALLAVAGGAVYAAYHTGRGQSAVEIARLDADLSAALESARGAEEKRAEAEEKARAAMRAAQSRVEAAEGRLPQGVLLEILTAAEARIEQGVPGRRLVELVSRAPVIAGCTTDVKRQPLTVRIPTSVDPPQTLSFADGRLLVAASGVALPPTEGHAASAFDATKPVELRFLQLGGEIDTIRGLPPLAHHVVVENQEHRFLIGRGKDESTLEVAVQVCPFP